MSEIKELIEEIRKELPNLKVLQVTKFGEEPFESGVWKLYLEGNEDIRIQIEVQNGMIYALYSSRNFENKYPIKASTICEFFREVES